MVMTPLRWVFTVAELGFAYWLLTAGYVAAGWFIAGLTLGTLLGRAGLGAELLHHIKHADHRRER